MKGSIEKPLSQERPTTQEEQIKKKKIVRNEIVVPRTGEVLIVSGPEEKVARLQEKLDRDFELEKQLRRLKVMIAKLEGKMNVLQEVLQEEISRLKEEIEKLRRAIEQPRESELEEVPPPETQLTEPQPEQTEPQPEQKEQVPEEIQEAMKKSGKTLDQLNSLCQKISSFKSQIEEGKVVLEEPPSQTVERAISFFIRDEGKREQLAQRVRNPFVREALASPPEILSEIIDDKITPYKALESLDPEKAENPQQRAEIKRQRRLLADVLRGFLVMAIRENNLGPSDFFPYFERKKGRGNPYSYFIQVLENVFGIDDLLKKLEDVYESTEHEPLGEAIKKIRERAEEIRKEILGIDPNLRYLLEIFGLYSYAPGKKGIAFIALEKNTAGKKPEGGMPIGKIVANNSQKTR